MIAWYSRARSSFNRSISCLRVIKLSAMGTSSEFGVLAFGDCGRKRFADRPTSHYYDPGRSMLLGGRTPRANDGCCERGGRAEDPSRAPAVHCDHGVHTVHRTLARRP